MTELETQTQPQPETDVFQKAYQLFSAKPDWVRFFREIMGVDGIVRKMYPTPKEMAEFEGTESYQQIQQMLTNLREGAGPVGEQAEPNRVITVRLPKSLHDLLTEEAYEHRTSVNKLCISKLLQIVDDELIPNNSSPGR